MIYVFGDYELDTEVYELRRAGVRRKLEPKAFDVLVYLIEHRDRVVSKEELLEHIWHTSYLSDAALNSSIMAVRRAVGDNGSRQSVIQTHRGRGYRFVASIDERDWTAQTAEARGGARRPVPLNLSVYPAVGGAHAAPPAAPQMGRHGMGCASCQAMNVPEAMFCSTCGVPLARFCGPCGQRVVLPARFCHMCGYRLGPAPRHRVSRPARSRSPFVGRSPERGWIEACLQQVSDGCGQVVAVTGEGVVGKSRLFTRIRWWVRQQSVVYLQTACASTPRAQVGAPIRELIRQCCDIAVDGSLDTAWPRLTQTLQACELRGETPALHDVDPLPDQGWEGPSERPPEGVPCHLGWILWALVQAHCRQHPLIIAIEDVEQLDLVSQDCLAMLASRLPRVPALLLLTCQHEERPAWLDTIGATTFTLPPLALDDGVGRR